MTVDTRGLPLLVAWVALALPAAAAPTDRAVAWRAARWGMAVEEVLTAFPGQATRIEPAVKLEDGNLIAAGIEQQTVEGETFRVRFIFSDGRLALVSLRTPRDTYAKPELYERLQKYLAGTFGGPGEETKDSNFIDLRQTRWDVGGSRVDLKYIPGTAVILYSRLADPGTLEAQAQPPGAPRKSRKGEESTREARGAEPR